MCFASRDVYPVLTFDVRAVDRCGLTLCVAVWGQHFFAQSTVVFMAVMPTTFVGTVSPTPSLRARVNLLLSAHQRSTLVDGLLRWSARVVCTPEVDGAFDHGFRTCTGTAAALPPDRRTVC